MGALDGMFGALGYSKRMACAIFFDLFFRSLFNTRIPSSFLSLQ